jgi:cyclopropane fatty-acyl-phospholipid synthase-like methyltransferase
MGSIISNRPWNNSKEFYDSFQNEIFKTNFHHYSYVGKNDDEFFNFILDKSEIKPNGKALDLGCGSGYLTHRLSKICNATGLANNLDVALSRFPNCNFILSDMETYKKEKYYDNILALESFGYAKDTWKTLNLIFKNLKMGGKFYLKDIFGLPKSKLTFKGKLQLMHWADYWQYSIITYNDFKKNAEKIGFTILNKEDIENKINSEHGGQAMINTGISYPLYTYPFPDEPYHEYLSILLQKV